MFLPLRTLRHRWLSRALTLPISATVPLCAADSTGFGGPIAVAIVFDTSGSMTAQIPTKPGGPKDSKIRIAQRSFGAVIDRLEAFTKGPAARPLLVGVYVFRGNETALAHPLSPFAPRELRAWLGRVTPQGPTPLGPAMSAAGRDLLGANASARHLLVLTDGVNTAGISPENVLDQLAAASTRKQTSLFTHVIALDIKPETFAALKKKGATLIGAGDEAQLSAQFDFILEEKILVEAPR
jgi:hypothetical protein